MTVANPSNYWISSNALRITLNANGDADYIQGNTASGAMILCYVKNVAGLGYDAGHNYQRWKLLLSPTFFPTKTAKYVYVAIPRADKKVQQDYAQVVFPSELLDIYGKNASEQQIGDTNYYYIWLQGIISASEVGGVLQDRVWTEYVQTGTLASDEAYDAGGDNTWWRYSSVDDIVTFLKGIVMDAHSWFENIRLGRDKKNIVGVANDTTEETNDDRLVTPKQVIRLTKAHYLNSDEEDIAQEQIGFLKGLWIKTKGLFGFDEDGNAKVNDFNAAGDADILGDLGVNGDATIGGILKALEQILTNRIQSDNFNGDGPFDTGFELIKDDGTGYSYAVVDKLYVRLKAIFNELEIRKISYSGGNFIFSHAGSHIVYVKELQHGVDSEVEGTVLKLSGDVDVADNVLNVGSGSVSGSTLTLSSDKRVYAYRCYIMKDDGTTATENWWRVDDQARCQTFNVVEPGHYENISNTIYWRRVIAVGHEKVRLNDSEQEQEYDYVDLSLIDCMQGSDIPKAGDQIVQMGNRTNAERQGFISLEVAGEYAPAFKVYKGVNYYTLDGKRKICISPKLTDIRAQKFTIETEYDTRLMPMERGDWSMIPEHKCYYYNLVQHNGASWLCVCPEGEYTTEEPSETATYWRPYAQKGKDGADSITTTLSTQTVEIPADTDGVCLEDTQVELSARLFVGSKEVKVTDIVVDEQSSQSVTSVVKSTLDMMPWATSADASVQGNVITFSRNASVQGAVLTIGGDAFNVTPSKVVVTIAKGTVVDEHTVNLRVTGVDEDKTTHYGFAAFNVQRHYIPVDGQDAINIIVTPAALIVNQSLQNPDNLSQLSEEIIFSATMGERQVAVNKVEITSTEHCTVEGSNGNKATVRAIGTYTEEGSHYFFDKANFICKVYTAYGVIEGIKADIYANLLGTWKETVEADTKTAIAQSTLYEFTGDSEVSHTEKLGEFIASSKKYETKLTSKVIDENGNIVKTSGSLYEQTSELISLSVESKENINLVPDPDIYQMLTSAIAITRDISLVKDRTYTLTARLKNTSSTATSCTIDIASLRFPCSLAAGAEDNFSNTFTAPATGTFTLTVPQTANVLLEWLQVEQGSSFTKHDNIGSAFQRTGIDIENGTIRLQANKVTFCDSSGGNTDKIWIDTTYGTLHAVDGEFEGDFKSGKYTDTVDQQEKYSNEINVDGSGHMAKGNISWNTNGGLSVEGIVKAKLMYSPNRWVYNKNYTINPNTDPYCSFYTLGNEYNITLPSANTFDGIELQFTPIRPQSFTSYGIKLITSGTNKIWIVEDNQQGVSESSYGYCADYRVTKIKAVNGSWLLIDGKITISYTPPILT